MPPLRERDADPDPLVQFGRWYRAAGRDADPWSTAMVVATATRRGGPAARAVLLNRYGREGFVFFTDYRSRKARELARNARAALVFLFRRQRRQVRIEGAAERLPPEESDAYFSSRPRGSQLAAWTSRQSAVVARREVLERRYAEHAARYRGRAVPRPPHWGGYRVVPDVFEFWQHRPNRLHDRLRYRRARDGWRMDRLAP